MTGVKAWVISGFVYLALVIAGYSLITGANPLASGEMHHVDHQEDNHGKGHGHNDHSYHPNDSEVLTEVSYKDGKLVVSVKDIEGTVLELRETHERLMHIIVVSDDLEEYYHFHPVEVGEGIFEVDASLEGGHYFVFVDIVPKGKEYVTYPITLEIGDHSHEDMVSPNLMADDNLLQTVNGKEVELVYSNLTAGEHVTLAFDLKDDTPLPYLGALGHVVIIDERIEQFIHVHPISHDETIFDAHFPSPGKYKLWAEFKFEETGVLVFPFVIEVE
ncbi:hypothetical protein J2S74_003620 [Evansella vedderi]|uniref:Secreted protein n=1 Tax=Evansella vedderi TaxID=38282 RepID=A0ABT9ZY85_9BACI|nr:hypothetical protein [Evansella vedderi]MDQ0256202.1 hypothetical protein [Evansella vedderi]